MSIAPTRRERTVKSLKLDRFHGIDVWNRHVITRKRINDCRWTGRGGWKSTKSHSFFSTGYFILTITRLQLSIVCLIIKKYFLINYNDVSASNYFDKDWFLLSSSDTFCLTEFNGGLLNPSQWRILGSAIGPWPPPQDISLIILLNLFMQYV